MFHFPRFPSATYVFSGQIIRHSPDWVSPFGYFRVNGCLPPLRNFSQAATSFLGIFCRAIHQAPLCSLLTDYSRRPAKDVMLISLILVYVDYSVVKVQRGMFELLKRSVSEAETCPQYRCNVRGMVSEGREPVKNLGISAIHC